MWGMHLLPLWCDSHIWDKRIPRARAVNAGMAWRSPPTDSCMSSRSSFQSRTAACLDNLSHAALLSLAISGCEASVAVQKMADALVGLNVTISASIAVESVLLSTDELSCVLAHLGPTDGVVTAVCMVWKTTWLATATSVHRRRLTQVVCNIPRRIGCDWASGPAFHSVISLAPVARDDTRPPLLVVRFCNRITIYDENLNEISHFFAASDTGDVIATHDNIWVIHEYLNRSELVRFDHDGNAFSQNHGLFDNKKCYPRIGFPSLKKASSPAIPSHLFCVTYDDDPETQLVDQMVVLNATTLEFCFNFGKGILGEAHQTVIVGDELLVCDTSFAEHCITVFDENGKWKRKINGPWRKPKYICHENDRLYLVECHNSMTTHHKTREDACARRIFVLSLTGETLQVLPVVSPSTPMANLSDRHQRNMTVDYYYINMFACFGGKLLLPMRARMQDGTHKNAKMLTLIGL